jgi:hypothetical protein
VMVILNTSEKSMKFNAADYSERTNGFSKGRNVANGKMVSLDELELNPKECIVLELAR